MKLTAVKIRKYRERKGQCLKQGISDIKPEFDFSETLLFMFMNEENVLLPPKFCNEKQNCKYQRNTSASGQMQKNTNAIFFCIFTASLKNFGQEKSQRWSERRL